MSVQDRLRREQLNRETYEASLKAKPANTVPPRTFVNASMKEVYVPTPWGRECPAISSIPLGPQLKPKKFSRNG